MAQVYRITEQCSGKSFECEAGQSVLKAMEQRGMKCVPVGCRGGGCGNCKIQVLAGEFECGKMSKVHVPPEALKKREVLACRVYPLTDLTIECRPPSQPGLASKQTKTTALR